MDLTLPKIIAHRGAPHEAPENTLPALDAANKLGAKWVEFDVMLTLDDVPVIIHDKTLNRTTNGIGRVSKTDYATLKMLDAGSWFSLEFSNTKIPTLEQYLDKAQQLGLGVNIEMKAQAGKEEKLAEQIISLLEKYWNQSLPTPLISSFSVENLIPLKNLACPYPIAYNTDSWHDCCRDIATVLNCFSIHMNKQQITKARVLENKKHNLHTLAYTVNSKTEADKLFELGVSAIFSDFPNML